MHSRMNHPVLVLPDAMKALRTEQLDQNAGLPESTIHLIEVRASQINGCGPCVDIHSHQLKRAGRVRRANLRGRRLARYRLLHRRRTRGARARRGGHASERSSGPRARRDLERGGASLRRACTGGAARGDRGINVWNRLNCATRQTTNTAAREAVLARA